MNIDWYSLGMVVILYLIYDRLNRIVDILGEIKRGEK